MKLSALLLLFFLPLSPALAQGTGHVVKDSIYFTLDDGEQSPEEMVEEAEYVYEMCNLNSYQKLYFDCACLAGAFLQKREAAGPTLLQEEILHQLTKTRNATCANTAAIAGRAYKDCLDFAGTMRETATDNEEFCSCTANKTAQDFAANPRLNIRYIRRVRGQAIDHCQGLRDRNAPR